MPPSTPLVRQRSPTSTARFVFIITTLAYAIACSPSYLRPLWPPPDRIVEGIPWIWVFGIPLFTLALPGGPACRRMLAAFATVTAILDALTLPYANMNPQFGTLFLWVANLILVLPLHLFVTVLVAPLSRFLSNRISTFQRSVVAAILVGFALVFPFAYRSITRTLDDAGGAKIADKDWADHRAGIITSERILYRQTADGSFASYFDPASGLPLWQSWYRRYEPGYTAEVRRIIATQGVPSWSQKTHMVSDADIIRIASDPGMTKVSSFPCQITPKLGLERDGGIIVRGTSGGEFSSRETDDADDQAFISTSRSGDTNAPVFVAQMEKYPGDYFVRSGKSVVVCTADGAILESADCEPPPSTRPCGN